jgi:GH25 family lysozyme M1 (1,4-beta-N-acetylmuramidase)
MSVKTYSYAKDKNVKLSEHFSVWEFRCKDGTDKILINTELIDILEKLYARLNCKAINVVSGYRTPSHSVDVGGYSTDQHTKGNAADINCKKKDGTIAKSSEVLCALEDLGFAGGVGRINHEDMTNVHIDVRGYKCWFDECNNERTTSSWYTYLGIKKPSTTTTQPTTTTQKIQPVADNAFAKGIDVSTHQGNNIDFNKVKAAGISFVILRAGYGRYIKQKDPTFEGNYKRAKAAGLKVGCYWYSYATDVSGAKAEVETFLEAVKGKQFEMPIFYDVEENSQFEKGEKVVSDMISTFLSATEAAGYFSGIYMSSSYLTNYVEDSIKKKYTLWVAHHDVSKCGYKGAGEIAMWQYTGKGTVNGVSGKVDMNYCYVDYYKQIRLKGLNGYDKIIPGDVNLDGKKTAADARDALRASAQLENLTEDQEIAADVNGDNNITAADAQQILKESSGVK